MRRNIYLLSILLFAVVLGLGCAGCSKNARNAYHLQKANHYFDAGQYDLAEVEYLNVLNRDRSNLQAINRLADIYFDEGRLLRATPFIVEAHRLATNDLDMDLKLAVVYLMFGKVKEAQEQASLVLDLNPKEEQAAQLLVQTAVTPAAIEETKRHLQRLAQKGDSAALQIAMGTIALRTGQPKSAEAAFKKAQTLDPKSSAAWSALAAIYLSQTNMAQVESALKMAADLAPARSAAKLQYANFKIQHGDPAAGKAILEEMAKKTPDYIPVWMALSGLAASEQKYDECASILNKVLKRDPENLNASLASARVKLAQGQIAGATTLMERLAKRYEQSPQVHYQLALAYLAGNETNKATASLKRAVALDPKFSEATLMQAGLQIRIGEVASAIVSLKQLTEKYPGIVLAQLLLADAYRVQGNLDSALGIYRQLQASYPKSFEFPFAMGLIYLQQKNKDEAARAFAKALELAPDNLTVLENIVDLDLSEKRYAEASQQVQLQLEKIPKLAAPYVLQGKIFMAQGDIKKAEEAFLKAVELQPNAEKIYMLLAGLYTDAKQYQKALAQLQIAAVKNPNDAMPPFLAGMIHNQEKDFKAARDAYEKALSINPQFAPALNNLSYLYSENLGDLEKAYELAQRARDILPNDPSTADTLGWILCKRGQYGSALGLLQECARQLPDEPEVQFHLGMACYQMHQEEAARLAFQKAIQSGKEFPGKIECSQCLAILGIDVKTAGFDARANLEKRVAEKPDDSIACLRLAAIYQRDGATDKAVDAYESALKAEPKNTSALINLAQLYFAKNNTQKALELAKAAYNLNPDNTAAALIRGRLAYATGDYKLALALLQQMAGVQPNNPQVLFDFARAAYAMGQVADAEAAMRGALRTGGEFPEASEAKRLLNMVALSANPTQAISTAPRIATILKSEPDYVPALMVLVVIYQQNHDLAAAKQTYLKVLGQYPEFSPAQRGLAILCAENADGDPLAYDCATKVHSQQPDDLEVTKALGIISYLKGDYTRSERLLNQAALNSNADSELLYYLGMAQYNLKKTSACKSNLQKALTLNLSTKFNQEAKRVLSEIK